MENFEKQLKKHKIKTRDEFIKCLAQRKLILITDKKRAGDNKYHTFPYCKYVKFEYFKKKVLDNKEENGSYYSFNDEEELEKCIKYLKMISKKNIRQCNLCSKMQKNSDLYFVENIINIEFENDDKEILIEVVLYKMTKEKSEKKEENFEVYEILKPVVETIEDGKYYCLYQVDKITIFEPREYDSRAQRELERDSFFITMETPEPDIEDETYDDYEVYSYHINVGHGNCSMLVLKNENGISVWMVDCGDYDFKTKSYKNNIAVCIDYITTKFKINKFFIDKIFLTHPHYDHYSGINRSIKKYIYKKTTIYLNQDYSRPAQTYNDTRKYLKDNATIININKIINNPKYKLPYLDIIYPDKTIIREKTTRHKNQNVDVEKNPNNASLQLLFNLNKKTILFTGDLEKDGLNKIKNCQGKINQLDYYCVSHHGSANGHERKKCPCNGISVNSIADCINLKKTRCILMGRNKAFNGIYCTAVTNELKPIYSEWDSKRNESVFLEIDWQNNRIKHKRMEKKC